MAEQEQLHGVQCSTIQDTFPTVHQRASISIVYLLDLVTTLTVGTTWVRLINTGERSTGAVTKRLSKRVKNTFVWQSDKGKTNAIFVGTIPIILYLVSAPAIAALRSIVSRVLLSKSQGTLKQSCIESDPLREQRQRRKSQVRHIRTQVFRHLRSQSGWSCSSCLLTSLKPGASA